MTKNIEFYFELWGACHIVFIFVGNSEFCLLSFHNTVLTVTEKSDGRVRTVGPFFAIWLRNPKKAFIVNSSLETMIEKLSNCYHITLRNLLPAGPNREVYYSN